MSDKKTFFDFTRAGLESHLIYLKQKKFHATQLFKWVYGSEVYDFSLMSNIGKSLIEQLEEQLDFFLPKIEVVQTSSDGTIKFLYSLKDNSKVETVIMPYQFGNSVCVSSQVGCNMGCLFCASGQQKKVRNLSAGEMVGQIIASNQYLLSQDPNNQKISNVVVMGTGEPFDNFSNVIDFISIINDDFGLGIGIRRITVSTCGIAGRIIDFADLMIPANLAISLHGTTDQSRTTLMPINKKYPLEVLLKALIYYQSKVNRKLTIEYLLVGGVNDSLEDAKRLYKMFRRPFNQVLINLIELNPVAGSSLVRSTNTNQFYNYLKQKNANVTVRKEFGKDIDASCGQLRAKVSKK